MSDPGEQEPRSRRKVALGLVLFVAATVLVVGACVAFVVAGDDPVTTRPTESTSKVLDHLDAGEFVAALEMVPPPGTSDGLSLIHI